MANKKKKKEYGPSATLQDYTKRIRPMTDDPKIYKKWIHTKKLIDKIEEGKRCRPHEVFKGGKCIPKAALRK